MQCPHKRLKFGNVLTVVSLLFLACTCIASLTTYSDRKVAKIVVRHKIVSVWAKSTHKIQRESSSVSGNAPEVSLLGCEAAGLTTLLYSTSQGLSPWPSLQMVAFSFSSFLKSPYTCLYTFAYKLK